MGTTRPFNVTWAIVAFVIVCNVILFQKLFSNVSTYADKVTSTRALAYSEYE